MNLDVNRFKLLTTKSFRTRLVMKMSKFEIQSAHTTHQYTSDSGVGWLEGLHILYFSELGLPWTTEQFQPRNYYDIPPDTVPNRDSDMDVVTEVPLLVYKVLSPLAIALYEYSQLEDEYVAGFKPKLEDYTDYVNRMLLKQRRHPGYDYFDNWNERREIEDIILNLVEEIIQHFRGQTDWWLYYDVGNNPQLPSIPNLSAYCVFIFFYKLEEFKFISNLYDILFNPKIDGGRIDGEINGKVYHQNIIEAESRRNSPNIIGKHFKDMIMRQLFTIIDNVFNELNNWWRIWWKQQPPREDFPFLP